MFGGFEMMIERNERNTCERFETCSDPSERNERNTPLEGVTIVRGFDLVPIHPIIIGGRAVDWGYAFALCEQTLAESFTWERVNNCALHQVCRREMTFLWIFFDPISNNFRRLNLRHSSWNTRFPSVDITSSNVGHVHCTRNVTSTLENTFPASLTNGKKVVSFNKAIVRHWLGFLPNCLPCYQGQDYNHSHHPLSSREFRLIFPSLAGQARGCWK